MAGAPIPDDWDGSTYDCYRVRWPSSEKWAAILLGQISEAAKETYYDENTGNPAIAAAAADDGFLQTLPDFWTIGCDDVPTAIPYFRVGQPNLSTIPSNVWTNLDFLGYQTTRNNPEWDFTANGHRPIADENMGLWYYHLQVRCTNQNEPRELRLYIPQTTFPIVTFRNRGHSTQCTFIMQHSIPGGTTIQPEVWSQGGGTLACQSFDCFMEGYLIGQVD